MTASAYVQTRCFAGCPAPLIATTSRTTLLAHRAATTLDRFGLREFANWSHTPILAASCAWKDPCGGIQGPHSRRAMRDRLLFNWRTRTRLGVIGGRCFLSVSSYATDLFVWAAAGLQPTDIRFCISGLRSRAQLCLSSAKSS